MDIVKINTYELCFFLDFSFTENTKIDTKTNTLAATQIKAEENLPILSRIVSKQSLKTSLKTALNCAVSPTQLQGQSNMQTLSGDDSSRDNIRTDDDLKIEPVYGFYGINAGEIDSLIQRPQTYLYEDVEMFFTTFPVPFNATKHDLFKRQGDIFSGNIAFNQTVCIFYSSSYLISCIISSQNIVLNIVKCMFLAFYQLIMFVF